jgi:hypothetical protein
MRDDVQIMFIFYFWFISPSEDLQIFMVLFLYICAAMEAEPEYS